ncbi:hypothetical protein P879_02946 [Paragonimus westermani]|uniref:Nudix hydrolase domain-containing protein n=1 Tax=Paragonimus westermani TaxID=34504 RepID=A0A8T0DQT1_9TREM|nr:hypothetical protein P879_02946 [Paragonimus westermani]
METSAISLPICRSWFCPFSSRNRIGLSAKLIENQSPPAGHRRWIPVASVCLLESPDADSLLLTRRSWRMRSYPGLWVPPGGHCDPAEPAEIAAVRELCEELGFGEDVFEQFKRSANETLRPLCAWEAAFPSDAPPTSHQLVVYYTAQWPSTLSNMTSPQQLLNLNLQEDEVCAAAWLPTSVLTVLINDWSCCSQYWREDNTISDMSVARTTFLPSSAVVNALTDEVWCWTAVSRSWNRVPLNQLICGLTTSEIPNFTANALNSSKVGPSPLSTGTLYAISEWLSIRNHSGR